MRFLKQWISVIALVALTAFGLAGCGGGGGGSASGGGVASVPSAPTGVTAVGGKNQITVNWNAVPGATSYNVYYASLSGVNISNGTKWQLPDAASISTTITGLTSGTAYYVVVTAVNGVGESVISAEKSATTSLLLAGPTGFSVTPKDGSNVLNWSAVTNASSYNIYWSTTYTTAANLLASGNKITGVASTSYTHQSLTDGTVYYYVVTAVVNNTETDTSVVQKAKPSTNPAPAAPADVAALTQNIVSNTEISVSWDSVPGATSYNIYYSPFPNVDKSSATLVANAGTYDSSKGKWNYISNLQFTNNSNYYFVVTAVGANGESTLSNEVSAVPVVFTSEMLIGHSATYTDKNQGGASYGQTLTFVCKSDNTLTFSKTTLTGLPTSGSGTWTFEPTDNTVTSGPNLYITIPNGSLTINFEMYSITGGTIGVYYNGTQSYGTIVVN